MATITLVQSRSGNTSNFPVTNLAYNSNVASGNLLVCVGGQWIGNSTTMTMGITSDQSAAFTVLDGPGGIERSWLSYALATGSGPCTVTLTPSTAGSYAGYTIAEFNIDTGGPLILDVNGGTNTGTGTAASCGITTVAAQALVIAVMSQFSFNNDTLTEDSGGGWTLLGELEIPATVSDYNAVYQLFSSAGAKTANWTISASENWGAQAASFKATSGGPTFLGDDDGDVLLVRQQ